jgi:hypothetical protein
VSRLTSIGMLTYKSMLEWKCCGLVIVELLQKRFKKPGVGPGLPEGVGLLHTETAHGVLLTRCEAAQALASSPGQ